MRLAIGGFGLESVTFLPEVTDVADFELGALRGDEVVARMRGTASVIGGFIDSADSSDVALEGLVYVNAGAAAAASDAAFEKYSSELVDKLIACRERIDGLLLFLHGALATPTRRQADAEVLRLIRAHLGDDFPIAVGMDLHGNLGPENLVHCTVLAGYYFSPHTDMRETGSRAANLLINALRCETRPRMAIAKPNVILPSIFSATVLEPLAELIRDARSLERENAAILDISVFCGFAYADVPDCGMSIVAITDDDQALAEQTARMLSDKAHRLRDQLFKRELIHSVSSALNYVGEKYSVSTRPFCLLEHADRLNDSTYSLKALIDESRWHSYSPFMFDPESASRCVEAGAGASIELELCGKSSPQAGGSLAVVAEVLDAGPRIIEVSGPLYTGTQMNLGNTALIRIQNVLVSLISVQWSAIDLDCFAMFDLDINTFDIVLLRSKTHFRHVYTPLCEDIVIVDTPDWGPADLTTLPYEYAPPAAFPLSD